MKKRTELPGDRLQLADAIEDQSTAHLARHCNLRQNYTMPVVLLCFCILFKQGTDSGGLIDWTKTVFILTFVHLI